MKCSVAATEEVIDNIYKHIIRNQFFDGLTKDEKRNFWRKVAKQQLRASYAGHWKFKAEDGKLYYCKQMRKGAEKGFQGKLHYSSVDDSV